MENNGDKFPFAYDKGITKNFLEIMRKNLKNFSKNLLI